VYQMLEHLDIPLTCGTVQDFQRVVFAASHHSVPAASGSPKFIGACDVGASIKHPVENVWRAYKVTWKIVNISYAQFQSARP
jgi:hypothetical protein